MCKRAFKIFILFFFLLAVLAPASYADLPTFDAANWLLSQFRNALMQSQFAQQIMVILDQLDQLRAQYEEIVRFHAGWDEFFEVFIGRPVTEARALLSGAYGDFGWITPEIEGLSTSAEPADIRASLEQITGEIPQSDVRPYIPFEEMQVVEGFRLAQEIRRAGEETRNAARAITEQARNVSPKGAVKLTAEALSQGIILSQQNQEAIAKLIELQATQVEQTSREEKRLERERLKYMEHAKDFLEEVMNAR